MGIAAGLILFVVCLTGTIYTFRTEIEQFIERDKFFVEVPANGQRLSSDELISIAKNEFQSKTYPLFLSLPTKKGIHHQH